MVVVVADIVVVIDVVIRPEAEHSEEELADEDGPPGTGTDEKSGFHENPRKALNSFSYR